MKESEDTGNNGFEIVMVGFPLRPERVTKSQTRFNIWSNRFLAVLNVASTVILYLAICKSPSPNWMMFGFLSFIWGSSFSSCCRMADRAKTKWRDSVDTQKRYDAMLADAKSHLGKQGIHFPLDYDDEKGGPFSVTVQRDADGLPIAPLSECLDLGDLKTFIVDDQKKNAEDQMKDVARDQKSEGGLP